MIRAKNIKVNEIRRILEIISTNRVDDEEEVATLAHLLDEANITSARYDQLMRSVFILNFTFICNQLYLKIKNGIFSRVLFVKMHLEVGTAVC